MGQQDRIVDEGISRLLSHTGRDEEFERAFGRWTRPEHLGRYDLERLRPLVRWMPNTTGMIDISRLIGKLDPHDRFLAGEIAKFVMDSFQGKPASDKVLHDFACHYLRRLDACGF